MKRQTAPRVVIVLAVLVLLTGLPGNLQAAAAPLADIPFPDGPHILADPQEDSVRATDWPGDVGTELTLTVHPDCDSDELLHGPRTASTEPADFDPTHTLAVFDLHGIFDLEVGQCLKVSNSDGTTPRELMLTEIHVLEVDQDHEIIKGSATPNASILVHLFDGAGTWRHANAGDDGKWQVDFSRPEDGQDRADIRPGSEGGARAQDGDRDGTHVRWIANSPFAVFTDANEVMGWDWQNGEWVVLEANAPGIPGEVDYTSEEEVGVEESGYFKFMNPSEWWFTPGQTVHVAYRGRDYEPYRFHTIIDLSIDPVTPGSGIVTGGSSQSEPRRIDVEANEGATQCVRHTDVLDGTWAVDFQEPGDPNEPSESTFCSLSPGASVRVKQYDQDRDHTVAETFVPSPHMWVWPEDDVIEQVHGYGWPVGTDLELYVDEDFDLDNGYLYSAQTRVVDHPFDPTWSHYRFNLAGVFDLRPGQVITVRDSQGDFTRVHQVTEVAVSFVNASADTVEGKAAPGTQVNVWREWPDWGPIRIVTASPDRDWIADFSSGSDTWDLVPGEGGNAMQWDDDGDATQVAWLVPPNPTNPTFLVRPVFDHVHGFDWGVGTLITLTIDRPDTPANPDYQDEQIAVEPRPDMVDFELRGIFDIRPNDIVTMTDGAVVKQHVVTALNVTNVNPEADIVGGTADPELQVMVGWLCSDDGCTYRQVETSAAGGWEANFAESGQEPSEWQVFDIQPGERNEAFQEDLDGDSTKVRWIAPTPMGQYLHGSAGQLFLDTAAPTLTVASFKDSGPVKRGGGNPWKEVGTWNAGPPLDSGYLLSLNDVVLWLGLKNSDDQGTRFDIRTEVYLNGSLVSAADRYCVSGLTRNPSRATQISLPFGTFPPTPFDSPSEVLSLRAFARIGTDGAGHSCGGHANATGVRLYYDSVSRPSGFDVVVAPGW